MASRGGAVVVSRRILIVDDEAPARRIVRSFLGRKPEIEIVSEATNGLEAAEAIRNLRPDLVFLDIQMPGMTGFEVIEAIGAGEMPAVIFVTAYDEFALDAFDVQAVDYLLKPFTRERFDRAFDRAIERLGSAGENGKIARLLAALPQTAPYLRRFVVRDRDRLFFVSAGEVIHLTAEGNYVRLHTAAGAHLIRCTLSSLEDRLDPARFVRIHRTGIVNVDAIKEVQAHFHGDYIVLLKSGERLRLSRRYQERLLK
ncbi:MAG TPA: LytTR family DNA-binding domain-containing protein [Thermoanaerobaculia bacterium]|nr:LytTR family DNA-binding domain-containing protein [Thermoanaerobaculia bacterium]